MVTIAFVSLLLCRCYSRLLRCIGVEEFVSAEPLHKGAEYDERIAEGRTLIRLGRRRWSELINKSDKVCVRARVCGHGVCFVPPVRMYAAWFLVGLHPTFHHIM